MILDDNEWSGCFGRAFGWRGGERREAEGREQEGYTSKSRMDGRDGEKGGRRREEERLPTSKSWIEWDGRRKRKRMSLRGSRGELEG